MKFIETGECLTIPVYQQGQGTFYCFQILRRGRGYIICQTARIPICAKVACYFEIKAGGLLEYKLSPVKITGPQTHLCHCPILGVNTNVPSSGERSLKRGFIFDLFSDRNSGELSSCVMHICIRTLLS